MIELSQDKVIGENAFFDDGSSKTEVTVIHLEGYLESSRLPNSLGKQ